MTNPTFQQRFGVTPGKTALTGILGSVFATVVAMQIFGGSSIPVVKKIPNSQNTTRVRKPVASTATQNASSKKPQAYNRTSLNQPSSLKTSHRPKPGSTNSSTKSIGLTTPGKIWPTIELQTAIAYDPFALPLELRKINSVAETKNDVVAIDTEAIFRVQHEQEKFQRRITAEKVRQRKEDIRNQQLAVEAERQMQIQRRQETEQQRAKLIAAAKAAFDQEAEEKRKRVQSAIEKIQENGFGIVLVTDQSRVVRIESKTYQQGDLFNGIRIRHINDDGSVVLEPADEPELFVLTPELGERIEAEIQRLDKR